MRLVVPAVLLVLLAGCAAPSAPRDDAPRDGADDPPIAFDFLRTGVSGRGGEPTLVALPDGTLFTTAWDVTLRSTDGGASWTSVYTVERPLPRFTARGVTYSGDPWLAEDPVTGRVFALHALLPCPALAWSDDSGDTWTRNDATCGSPYDDHPELGVAPPGPDANPLAAGARSVVYLCLNKGSLLVAEGTPAATQVMCRASYDGGSTWPVERVLAAPVGEPEDVDCRIDHGPPAAGPSGVVVVPASAGCARPALFVTRDSGNSWVSVPGPEGPGVDPFATDPAAAFDPDGTLYLLWQGADHLKWLARTSDLGATWAGPWKVSPPTVTTTDFQTLAAGADGRVAIAFLGSGDTDAYAGRAPPEARFHLWIATSDDALADVPSFAARQVTPDDDPVQIGCTNAPPEDGPEAGSAEACANLGDFIGSAVGPDGSFLVAFADGCGDGCAGDATATWKESRGTETVVVAVRGFPLAD